jgi:hypothetical protein
MKPGDYIVIKSMKLVTRKDKRGFEEHGVELDRGLVVGVHACGFAGSVTLYGCTLLSQDQGVTLKTWDLEWPLVAEVLHEAG